MEGGSMTDSDMRDRLTAERDAARAQCAEAVREGNEARAALAEISELVGAGGDGTPFGRVESMLSASRAALAAETEKREAAERAVDTLREALEAVASTAAHSDIRNMAKVGLDLAADIDGNRSFYKEAHARAIEWGRNQERATIDTRIAAARAEGAQAVRKDIAAAFRCTPESDLVRTATRIARERLVALECLDALVRTIESAGLNNLAKGVQLGATSWLVKASDHVAMARGILDAAEKPEPDVSPEFAGLGGAPAQPSEWMTLEEAAREYVAARWALSLAELANGDENKSAAAREAFAYANLHNIVNGARVDRAAGRAAPPSPPEPKRGHEIHRCSCGALIMRCKCPGPHAEVVVPNGCPSCRTKPEDTRSLALAAETQPAPRELPERFNVLDESDDHLGGAFVYPMKAETQPAPKPSGEEMMRKALADLEEEDRASGLLAAPDEPHVGDVWAPPRGGEFTVEAIRDGMMRFGLVPFEYSRAELALLGWRLVRRGEVGK